MNTSCKGLVLEIPAKDKSEVFQRVLWVSGLNSLSGQYNDEANWKEGEICCIQAVSGTANSTGG